MPRLTTTTNLNVGLLIDWLALGYQGDIIDGVVKAASERGANLLLFFGGAFTSESLTDPHDSVFARARQPAVDGVVAAMGTLVPHLGPESSGRALNQLGVPVVSIGLRLENTMNIGVDNCAGLKQLCEHLVLEHGRKSFAMIAGPTQSTESEERVYVCRDTLQQLKIELPEERITHQEFAIAGGERGIEELFDRRNIKVDHLDTILCANDLIAEGALEELSRRKISVPEKLAITGFDGLERASYLAVPLSTVSQPLEELGHEAMRGLLQTLDGIDVPKVETLPSRLVIRRSCGCITTGSTNLEPLRTAPPTTNGVWSLFEHRELVRAALARSARGQFSTAGAGWEERWLMALLEDLRDQQGRTFLVQLDATLRHEGRSRNTHEVCHRVLSELREQVLAYIGTPALCRRFEDILHASRQITSSSLERLEVNRRLATTGTLYSLMHTMERLVRLIGQPRFWQQLEIDLVRLGIHTCVVTRYTDDEQLFSNAAFLFSKVERDWDKLANQVFATADILPGNRIRDPRDYPLVIRILVHAGKAYGTIVFSFTGNDLAMYEAFASIVALQLSQNTSN